jgi:predicted nucleic acid-binding protein
VAVLVSDTSVVVDLERGGLLDQVFQLAHEFAVPDLLFERELAGALGQRLMALGLRVEVLSGEEVAVAARLARAERALSAPDAFAFAVAHSRTWTLLTGDGALRRVAEAEGLETHGVLWLMDELERELGLGRHILHDALSAMVAHPRCRLPRAECESAWKFDPLSGVIGMQNWV